MAGVSQMLLYSLKQQTHIEIKNTRLDLIRHYYSRLSNDKVKGYTTEDNSANPNVLLKKHIHTTSPVASSIIPNNIDEVPIPLYGLGLTDKYTDEVVVNSGTGLNIYQKMASSTDADKILIPSGGLYLSRNGGLCTPVCTATTGKWKIWVQWAALENKKYDFYLRVESINKKGVNLKNYKNLLSKIGGGSSSEAIPCLIIRKGGNKLVSMGCNDEGKTVNANVTGTTNNVFIGDQAGNSSAAGSSNNFLGNHSGGNSRFGSYNNFLGYQAGYSNITGHRNNFLGLWAGRNNTTGRGNIYIGSNVNPNHIKRGTISQYKTSGDNNIFLGSSPINFSPIAKLKKQKTHLNLTMCL